MAEYSYQRKNEHKPLALAREVIAIGAGVSTLTVPNPAELAFCRLETNDIRFTLDGTIPTSTIGTPLRKDEILELQGRSELLGFQGTQITAGASLNVEYFTEAL